MTVLPAGDPAFTARPAAALPGRELLDRIRAGLVAPPPMPALLGFELLEVGEGEVRFACTPGDSTGNAMGVVHGGLLCTLLDTAAGCALHTLLPAGAAYSTIEIKVSYLRPVVPGTRLEATGRVLRRGRAVAFADAEARDAEGRLVGTATTSLAVAAGPATT